VASPGAVALPAAGGTGPTADRLAAPARSVRPKFRWWWPDGLVDPDETAREIDQIADAGFGGVEIAAVHHGIEDEALLDTARHGWGGGPCRDGVEAALRRAARRGLTVDITLGPSRPEPARGRPADRLSPVIGVGPLLRRGENTVETEVATPLVNRLRTTRPEVFGSLTRQDHGLVGPVEPVPYAQPAI
jgi:hypothetical protein